MEQITLPDGELLYWPHWLAVDEAMAIFYTLQKELAWQQDEINIAGRAIPIPRLQAWYGDSDAAYCYSGLKLTPQPWTELLRSLRQRLQQTTGSYFNSVLANCYRDGRDSVGWHADDETELGRNPVIASVSLGAVRRFVLKHRKQKNQRFELSLPHGSLLLMRGALQHHWWHQVPKTVKPVDMRINLTFRYVKA